MVKEKKQTNFLIYIIPIIVAFFNVIIILFPKEMIEAASEGLQLWFNRVLPSLLPFIIGTNILIDLGFVSFLGTLLESAMTKLFNIPGCGAFALTLGMTSGYPIGAKITSDLRLKKQITLTEAQRLISFTNNSGPLFILGAVAIGMFNSKSAGILILICHYLGSLTVGLIFRFYKSSKNIRPVNNKKIFKKAFQNLRTERIKLGKSFGEILGESVKNGMETIVTIGGFVILFCVLLKILEILNIMEPFQNNILLKGIFSGFIEITNGCNVLKDSPSILKIPLAAGIISWGGLSIHAQTISFISKTDINIFIYILSKILHGFISFFYCLALLKFIKLPDITAYSPVFKSNAASIITISSISFASITILILLFGISLCLVQKIIKAR